MLATLNRRGWIRSDHRIAGRRLGCRHGQFISAFCILTSAFLFTGCVSAHKKGRTIHERFDYQIVQPASGEPVALLTCHEIWMDEFKGGGVAFLSDPTTTQLVSVHTNQIALGGGSALTVGSFQSQVSTNGILAAGAASSQIIQGIGAAVGQAANKAVTGGAPSTAATAAGVAIKAVTGK